MSSRIELEIEKSREESNWPKVIELAEQLKEKSRDYGALKQVFKNQTINSNYIFVECLADFLIGEGKLENYLEEWPAIEAHIHHAKLGLIEAKRYLQMVTNEKGVRVR